MTVAGRPAPPAKPTEATDPPYLICPSNRASISPPTASMQPPQISASSGRLTVSFSSARATICEAPRDFK